MIEAERLRLRLWKEADREEFTRLNSNPHVMEFFPERLSRNESDRFLTRIRTSILERGYGFWATEIKADRRFIGFIGFNYATFQSSFTPCVEIGWRLKKEVWGRGYATEGAKACLKFGFSKLALNEIYAFTTPLNERSERVMVNVGMEKIGEFQHPGLPEGHPLRLHVLYRITREQFHGRQSELSVGTPG